MDPRRNLAEHGLPLMLRTAELGNTFDEWLGFFGQVSSCPRFFSWDWSQHFFGLAPKLQGSLD